MLIDFTPLRDRTLTFQQVADPLTVQDLRAATASMVDAMLASIAVCQEEDLQFLPSDADASEAEPDADGVKRGWTLGHIIAHTTATAEETAFIALELARGIPFHGRSRSETPWETLQTIEQCRQRLQESKRMRLASLEAWPDQPDLENRHEPFPTAGELNAKGRFTLGLVHDDRHRLHLAEVVRQVQAAHAHG